MPIKYSQSDEMSNEKHLNGKENRQVSSTSRFRLFVMSWVKNYHRNMNLLMRSTDDDVLTFISAVRHQSEV